MSWNYAINQINASFDQIAVWYRDFMTRTERSFQAMNARIMYLENRQAWKGPSDEQVERILRKILAEKFAENAAVQRVENPNVMENGQFYVQKPTDDLVVPKPLVVDSGILSVDSNAVPSDSWKKDFDLLKQQLAESPQLGSSIHAKSDQTQDVKSSI
ncbi:hypothetical protein K469DRAFT_553764 [Zopfia rhizophila CBS 207.26]|uniref:Uncharacterized protein n=1 Tax=Zopfia rhizophila CBS 207.26 TaxID=1314779 RepID=A0A6A6ENC1_9PEZI|nr:hypothetical protein K469DRAFT_553764 [Zopfia rhizophila CBS 207.26]